MRYPLYARRYKKSGCVILPVIADAAATAGFDKYTKDFGLPILPIKFRLVVASATSPSVKIPMCPPRHGPQVGVENTPPALTNISAKPSFAA